MMIEFWIVFCADPKSAVFKALGLNSSNMSHLAVIPLQHSSKAKISSCFLNLLVVCSNFGPKVLSTFIQVCTWAGQGLFNSPNKSIHRSWNCVRLQLWRELPINVFLPCQLLDDIRSRWDSKLLWIKTQLFGFLAKQWCCVEWHDFFEAFLKLPLWAQKKQRYCTNVLVKKCKRFFTLFRKHKWFWKLFTQMIQESYLANFEPEADLLCKPSQF